jgi:hypothetical protein
MYTVLESGELKNIAATAWNLVGFEVFIVKYLQILYQTFLYVLEVTTWQRCEIFRLFPTHR